MELSLGASVGISSRLTAESDADFADLATFVDKIRRNSLASIFNVGLLPSSIRLSSAKITVDQVSMLNALSFVINGIIQALPSWVGS
jgi:hypothetical protein